VAEPDHDETFAKTPKVIAGRAVAAWLLPDGTLNPAWQPPTAPGIGGVQAPGAIPGLGGIPGGPGLAPVMPIGGGYAPQGVIPGGVPPQGLGAVSGYTPGALPATTPGGAWGQQALAQGAQVAQAPVAPQAPQAPVAPQTTLPPQSPLAGLAMAAGGI
jgi:hypothetical protein